MIVLLCIIAAAGIVAWVLWMLLTRRLREKYAVLWLVLGVVLLLLGIFPGLLEGATKALGVQLPVNLLFTAAIVVLLGIALHQSWELSQSEDEARRLAEEVAILGARIDRIESAAEAGEPPEGRSGDGSADDR